MMMATSAEFSTSLVLCTISKPPIWNLINLSTAITVLLLLLLLSLCQRLKQFARLAWNMSWP
jgi:hypothetical protein